MPEISLFRGVCVTMHCSNRNPPHFHAEHARYKCLVDICAGGVFAQLADDAFFAEALTVLNDAIAWDTSGHYDPTTRIGIDPFVAYEAQQVTDPLEAAA